MSTTIDGVLVRLSISQFQNSKQDGVMTKSVTAEHNLGDGSGAWTKRKFPTEALRLIKQHVSRCRTWHYDNTLPWEDGLRLLGSQAIEAYDQKSVENRLQLNESVNDFIRDYNQWIDKARVLHNGTFNEGDYPSRDLMRDAFKYTWEIMPVPTSGGLVDLVGKLSQERLEALRTSLTEANALRLQEAVRDVWRRVLDPVMSLATRLTSTEAAYRGTLVQHLREIVEHVPALNITNDQRLVDIGSSITTMLAGVSDESLKDSKVLVNQTAEKAINILKTFGDYGTRSFE